MWQRFKRWCVDTWNSISTWWCGTGIGSRVNNAVIWISNIVRAHPRVSSVAAVMGTLCLSAAFPTASLSILIGLALGVVLFSGSSVANGLFRLTMMGAAAMFGFALCLTVAIVASGSIGALSLSKTAITIMCLTTMIVVSYTAMKQALYRMLDSGCSDTLQNRDLDRPNQLEIERLKAQLPQLVS